MGGGIYIPRVKDTLKRALKRKIEGVGFFGSFLGAAAYNATMGAVSGVSRAPEGAGLGIRALGTRAGASLGTDVICWHLKKSVDKGGRLEVKL